ncbi:MAG: alpha/beta hydrolase [Phycisphaerales bacterium]
MARTTSPTSRVPRRFSRSLATVGAVLTSAGLAVAPPPASPGAATGPAGYPDSEEKSRVEPGTRGGRGGGVTAQPEFVQPESLAQGFILVVTDKQGVATSDSPIFIASNHNGWNPGDPGQKLTPRSDRRWQIVFPKPRLDSRLAFKFTRGSWDNVEVDSKFADVENRSLPKIDVSKLTAGEPPIIELTIEAFKDRRPAGLADHASDRYRQIKATGTIRRIEVVGGVGGGVPVSRDLIVWLPPGYDDPATADRTYPVLYLNDGQNVFEKLPNVPGEWEADETATRLIVQGAIEPIIIVGIPSAGATRHVEYLPAKVFETSPARGEEYLNFLIGEVIPRVERTLRTRPGPANRAIGGSSLGAIISLYAASKRPDVFGKVLAESPSLSIRGSSLMPLFEAVERWPDSVYVGVGTREDASEPEDSDANRRYVELAAELVDLTKQFGAESAASNTRLAVDPGATHTESAWAHRLEAALRWLFPPAK